jgi:DNA topoisomerase-1
MGRKLVIVESPSKARTINKMLGEDFIVKASNGHIRDLPEKKLGVDIEKNFTPHYSVMKGKQKVIKELEKAAEGVDGIYLAPDPDREGEAIAWHLKAALKGKVEDDQFFRVTYNQITAPAIREAFEHPTAIDMRRVDSQQARRVLDRIVGYKVSPLLWKRVRGGSSAGRVQSVALRLVCEREREIDSFVREKYWIMGVNLRKLVDPRDEFPARLLKIDGEKADIKSQELAERIFDELQNSSFKVGDVRTRDIVKRARPPYITSTLQQAASGTLGFSPSRTMSIAQKLYEGGDMGVGLITYMRTDSVNVAKEAQESCREFIKSAYGDEYVPEKPNRFKSRKSAQEAHEAIRPTDVMLRPEAPEVTSRLKPEELKLYRLIWQRFVASQMAPARISQRSVDVTTDPGETVSERHEYLFRATSSEVTFPGYMTVTGVEKKKRNGTGKENDDEDGDEVDSLPPLEAGENLECTDTHKDEKETQPPARYSEASLVRALEENGVGRPSTYASIISTIQQRKYIQREKRSLKPTELGLNVNDFLVTNLPNLFDIGFTAEMEESLDQIESGDVQWTDMLSRFYGPFEEWLEKAKGPKADPEKIAAVLKLLEQVKEWGPETKRGKRVYSDRKFVESIQKQYEKGTRAISARQRDSLLKIVHTYRDQLDGLDALISELGYDELMVEISKPPEPPRENTMEKLNAFERVTFAEPREVGKRTYDDGQFVQSLKQQVEGGKRLSDRQVAYLDRLLIKYSDQLGGKEDVMKRFAFDQREDSEQNDTESGPLLELLAQVKEWNEPVKRGNRLWDDKSFHDSLKRQYTEKKALSPRQRASMKKMVQRYHAQIENYDQYAERFGLKKKAEIKTRTKKKETAS